MIQILTNTKDSNGNVICLGDTVEYCMSKQKFVVVFEENAFRKSYKGWDDTLTKPILETGDAAARMLYRIVARAEETITAKFEGIDLRTINCACGNPECFSGISFDKGNMRFHFLAKTGGLGRESGVRQEEKSIELNEENTRQLIEQLKSILREQKKKR